MKNTLRLLTLGATVAGITLLSSCGKKSDDATPAPAGPTASVTSVNGNTTVTGKNATLEFANGDTLKITINKTGSGLSYSSTLATGNVVNGTTRSGDTTISIITNSSVIGNSSRYFVVRSSSGKDSISITLQRSMSRYTQTILTAPLASNDSKTFITLSTGQTWDVVQATNSPSVVDLGFVVGATTGGILMSPDNWFTTGGNNPYAAEVGGWSTRNATQIWVAGNNTSITQYLTSAALQTAFEGGNGGDANRSNVLAGAQNNGISSRVNSRVGNLTAGDQLVFKTAAGKHGIIRINSVVANSDRTGQVNVTYKIQN